MAFEKNIRGLRIDGDISVSTVSGTTFSAGTSINVGGIAGFYADSTKAIIGGLPVAGFNGAVGVFNARSSMAGINRMFVGESASLNTSKPIYDNRMVSYSAAVETYNTDYIKYTGDMITYQTQVVQIEQNYATAMTQ